MYFTPVNVNAPESFRKSESAAMYVWLWGFPVAVGVLTLDVRPVVFPLILVTIASLMICWQVCRVSPHSQWHFPWEEWNSPVYA